MSYYFEPRLYEYIKKKEYYSKNNITPCIPLEKEYNITQDDLRKIQQIKNNPKLDFKFLHEDLHSISPKISYEQHLLQEHMKKKEKEQLDHDPHYEQVEQYLDNYYLSPPEITHFVNDKPSHRTYTDPPRNECVMKIREQYHGHQKIDTELMEEMQFGMPYHTRKSYGYSNPFESYFDYIDGEIQNPDHVVLPFPRGGESTRLDNTEQVRKKTGTVRNIM